MNRKSCGIALAVSLGALLLSPQAGLCEDTNADIKSTPEFRLLCQGFHEDIELQNSTFDQIVEEAIPILGGQKPESIAALRVFLDDVLSGRYSGEQINKLWNTCPPDIYVSGPLAGTELLKAARRRVDLPSFGQK